MSLRERVAEYVRAGFAGIWISSFEHDDAIRDLAQLCRDESWSFNSWDIDAGFQTNAAEDTAIAAGDPLAAVRSIGVTATEGVTLTILSNFHRFLGSPEITQALVRQIILGKQTQSFVIVLAPVIEIPKELEKLFICMEHELPARDQVLDIAQGIATLEGELPDGANLNRVLDAASGLTRYEAEGAFSLAICRHGKIEPSAIWELKAQALQKSGLLSLHRGQESFDNIGGLDSLKAFCRTALRHRESQFDLVKPRGVLLLGVPGTGKSAFAKALGNETGRPTLTLDVGSLMGSLVGQSEQRTRQALQIVDAMQPAILFVDELEKGLAGSTNSGQTDSGVIARMLGTLLGWLNDHESDVFVVCTANDISKLPPELTRAERMDAIFFLDLPSEEQRQAIWRLYLKAYSLDVDQELPHDDLWTGAEIQSCCRLSALLDVPLLQAAQNVVPIAVTNAEKIDQLRRWANGRCLSAETTGTYRSQQVPRRSRRRIERTDPSNN